MTGEGSVGRPAQPVDLRRTELQGGETRSSYLIWRRVTSSGYCFRLNVAFF